MDASIREVVPVTSKLANRFYEPLIITLGLNAAYSLNQSPQNPDVQSDKAQSAEYDFHRFVDKLAQLCQTEPGGDSVTAFVVLNPPEGIQYRFACNQRKKDDLIQVKTYISSILTKLGTVSTDTLTEMISPILRQSLSFTRSKVQAYVRMLVEQTVDCIKACKRENTDECKYRLQIQV